MSHPHGVSLFTPAFGGQPKTLFVQEAQHTAVLWDQTEGQDKKVKLQFPDPHTALDWCLAHGAGMVFSRAPDPKWN
jgi:hypothetical protein